MRLLLSLLLLLPLSASAARADRLAPEESRVELVAPPGGGSGAGASSGMARRWIPPEPVPPVTNSELRAALERARPEMQACIDTSGLRSGTVRARISRDAALRLTIRSRPRDAAAEACVETAARRHVTALLSRPIARALSASVRLGSAGPRPPVVPPPPPPVGADDREIHERLNASSGTLRRCLDEAFPGMTGTVSLRVVAHRDGSMVLEGASLPPGVPAGPMLVCLQNEVLHLRVSAGGERSVTHDLFLGR
jgi:hypothetical protein